MQTLLDDSNHRDYQFEYNNDLIYPLSCRSTQIFVGAPVLFLNPLPFNEHYGLKFDLWLSKDQADTASDFVRNKQLDQLVYSQEHGVKKEDVERILIENLLATCEVPTENAQNPEEKENKLRKLNPILAGNSTHGDYRMIKKNMPNLADLLNYRLIDMTTVKELLNRWTPL